MTHKHYLLYFLLLLIPAACSKDADENPPTEEVTSSAEVSTNPADPLLLRVTRKDKTVVQYFGEKSATGVALNCNTISVQKADALFPTLIEIDKTGRPVVIHSPDGSFVKMDWLSNEEVRILAVTPKGEVQVSIPVNLKQIGKRGTSTGLTAEKRTGELTVAVNPVDAGSGVVQGAQAADLKVKVMRCGQPFNSGYVNLLMSSNDGKYTGHKYGTSLANGVSTFRIENPNDNIKLSDVCGGIETVLGGLCNFVNPFTKDLAGQVLVCTQISLAIDFAVFGPTGESIPLFAGCESIFGALTIYCETLGGSADILAPSLLENLCKLAKKAESTPQSFTFKPMVYVQGEPVFEGEKTASFPVSGPFPEITVMLPNKPKIENFATVPADPSPKESYTASAQIYCGKAGTKAIIMVVGTDGYTKTNTVTLPDGMSKVTIAVPGGAGGVQDRLTVEVVNVAKMYASIVF
ncbi:hypothetical protein [Hymenobacter elongatus]|uniref:Uncharacterized protein n=1 Tax=Hymenobacter elongatus TaxID=877208 RepID=A0A4Z0PS60_9BACT|nr:hypothetical protein [Hymenobacter elongatus]TGE18652.1 hypothetical protein E5J99_04925 [Hymenobacter elongatus]